MRTKNGKYRMSGRALATVMLMSVSTFSYGCASNVDTTKTASITPLSNEHRLDYRAGYSPSAPSRKAEGKVYLGSAPYVCSPSGFGRTSQCFLR